MASISYISFASLEPDRYKGDRMPTGLRIKRRNTVSALRDFLTPQPSTKKWRWHQVGQACKVVYLLPIGSFK